MVPGTLSKTILGSLGLRRQVRWWRISCLVSPCLAREASDLRAVRGGAKLQGPWREGMSPASLKHSPGFSASASCMLWGENKVSNYWNSIVYLIMQLSYCINKCSIRQQRLRFLQFGSADFILSLSWLLLMSLSIFLGLWKLFYVWTASFRNPK